MSSRNSDILIKNASQLFGAGAGADFQFGFEGDSDALAVQEVRGRLSGECRVLRGDRELIVVGSLSWEISVPCRRCAEPVAERTETSFDGRFVAAGNPKSNADSDLYDPEVFTLDRHGAIDLTDLLRETAIASISPNVVCRDDCAGLCPVCGNNLNDLNCGCEEYDVGLRWAPLKELLKKSLAQSEIDGD